MISQNWKSFLFVLTNLGLIVTAVGFMLLANGATNQQNQAIELTKQLQFEISHIRIGLADNVSAESKETILNRFKQSELHLNSLHELALDYYLFTQQDYLAEDIVWLKNQLSLLENEVITQSDVNLVLPTYRSVFENIHHRLHKVDNALVSSMTAANQAFVYSLFAMVLIVALIIILLSLWVTKSRQEQSEYTMLLEEVNELARQKNTLLLEENERNQNYLDVAAVMILVLDHLGHITMINQKGCQVLGYSEEELLGRNWFDLCIAESSREMMRELYQSIMFNRQPVLEHLESEVMNRSGDCMMVAWKNVLLTDDSGNIRGMISSGEDVTELKETEQRLAHLAHHDTLTGLPNRSLLNARLQHALQIAHRQPTNMAVCFFDIDNFKTINDSYGHDVGDELLITISERIQKIIRKNDTLARLGGDEFVLVLEGIQDKTEVAVIIEKILKAFSEPMELHGQVLSVTSSIGISLYPQDGLDVNSLIKYADTAMYQAKGDGKNTYAFYAEHMTEELMERVYMQKDLVNALAEDQFEVFYQPQVDLATNKAIGLEALVRWRHPEKGMIMPNEFIRFAEESNSIKEIGYKVLKRACLDIKELHDEGLFDGYVAVNVSAIQLKDHAFIPMLVDLIEETGIEPHWLELELTESVVMNESKEGVSMLESIGQLGVKIAIDDFGTGYSSLSYLSELPFDKLKIDMSFIRNILCDEKARTVAEAIIQLSNSMNMTTLAEGIEKDEQIDYLRICKCEQGQGYLFSKPKPKRKLKRWLKKVA